MIALDDLIMLDAIAIEGILNKYFSHSEHAITLRLHCNNYNRQHNDANATYGFLNIYLIAAFVLNMCLLSPTVNDT